MLSNYFKNTSLEDNRENLINFKKEKNIHQMTTSVGDRTVCQMLRNINVLTQYKYENNITVLIKYINDAVLKLRDNKKDFDQNWWNNKNSVNFNRSIFDPYYLSMSEILLCIQHPLFITFLDLYNNINDINIKNFILESVYYTYKINLRLCEYENLYKPLTAAGENYTNQWNNILNTIKQINMTSYDPYLITFLELRNRFNTKPYYIKDGVQTPLTNTALFQQAFDYSRLPVWELIKNGDYDTIIELGSGFGRNIYYYISLLKHDCNFYMGEYTAGGIETAIYIKNRYFSNKKIQINHFDYNNFDVFFEQLKLSKKMTKVLVCTFWSIEQITNIQKEVFDNILSLSDTVTCVHIEPVGWQISDKSIMKKR